MRKTYIIWYRDNSVDDPDGIAHTILAGKNAVAAKRLWKLMYPACKFVRMRVWH